MSAVCTDRRQAKSWDVGGVSLDFSDNLVCWCFGSATAVLKLKYDNLVTQRKLCHIFT